MQRSKKYQLDSAKKKKNSAKKYQLELSKKKKKKYQLKSTSIYRKN